MTKPPHTLSASILGVASASRIWRTVVFSGAILGAPLTGMADDAKPAKPQPETEAQVTARLERELATLDAAITKATSAALQADTDADRKATVATFTALHKQRDGLRGRLLARRLASEPRSAPNPFSKPTHAEHARELESRSRRELMVIDREIADAVQLIVDDARRVTATATIVRLQARRVEAETKLAALRAEAAAPRPRTDEVRPKGRGFVLG